MVKSVKTKTYKFKIKSVVDDKRDNFTEAKKWLGDLVYVNAKVQNYALGLFNRYHLGEDDDKLKEMKLNEFDKYIRTNVKEKFKDYDLPLTIYSTAVYDAKDVFKKNKKDMMRLSGSLPTMKLTSSVLLQTELFSIDENFNLGITLLDSKKAKELGRTGRRKGIVDFKLDIPNSARPILNGIIDGTNKLCMSRIKKDSDGTWYFILTYQEEIESKELDNTKILGIDLGITNAVVMSISGTSKYEILKGGEVESFRKKIQYRRKSFNNQYKTLGNNRRGKGKNKVFKPTRHLSDKESNFSDLINDRYSKFIVEYAIKNNCGIIQLEDLSGINKKNKFLKDWAYYDLKIKIKDKAEPLGIEVREVCAVGTSLRCNHCGNIHLSNRLSRDEFYCQTCKNEWRRGKNKGKPINADINASRNLSIENIDSIIEEYINLSKDEELDEVLGKVIRKYKADKKRKESRKSTKKKKESKKEIKELTSV